MQKGKTKMNKTINTQAQDAVLICQQWQIDELCASGIIVPVDYDSDDSDAYSDYSDDIYSDALNQLN